MNEILKFKGRLAEKELEGKKLRLRIEGLRNSIRELLDPFEGVVDLNCEVVAEQALEMASLQVDLKAVLGEIGAIKKALGKG